ncbi:MAG: ribosome-associated translation inhibitor RaiA [Candidatus Eisenbacteria bacterium]|uniref:Ribosome-associated translation inhibitor RaiA n=1 Tax=Eiseniibacteriota bacterium TaxID=2212470 RepID=A0A538T1Z8_UNCEI|nr:MAG: ribosome-associated translation inhibitor RaiA [Candidatus Eisenbacteria bacterium]
MQITIKGRHWKVTPDYREYAERRIEKLQRYFSHLISAQLTVTEEGYRHLAELRIFGNGFDLTGKAQNPDPKAALDAVLEKQERALKRRKERMKGYKTRDPGPAPRAGLLGCGWGRDAHRLSDGGWAGRSP